MTTAYRQGCPLKMALGLLSVTTLLFVTVEYKPKPPTPPVLPSGAGVQAVPGFSHSFQPHGSDHEACGCPSNQWWILIYVPSWKPAPSFSVPWRSRVPAHFAEPFL